MGDIAAIGEEPLIRGFALAGVRLFPCDELAAVRAAWAALPPDIDVVIMTPAARQALSEGGAEGRPLVVVTG